MNPIYINFTENMPLPNEKKIFEALKDLHKILVLNIGKFKEINDFQDTGIDPLTTLIKSLFMGIKNKEAWLKNELDRRVDKALTNAIGLFHEKILSSVPGWYKPAKIFDLKNDEKKIIVEIKNKHNTLNSSSSEATFLKFKAFIKENPTWLVYLTHIIPKKGRINKTWCIEKNWCNQNIRLIDGATLYEIVTDESDAMKKIYCLLPKLAEKIGGIKHQNMIDWCNSLLNTRYKN